MSILITGAKGMLGREIAKHLANEDLLLTDVEELDITNTAAVKAAVIENRPSAIIHCAAMTAVDDCESNKQQAFLINETGSANVAHAAAETGSHLIAISTDYVFDGTLDRPYHEADETNPQSVYGASKLAGERAIQQNCPNHTILRIAWLYGPGGPSFVHTMLRLLGQEGEPLKVVNDQVGNPTSTAVVAQAVEECLQHRLTGIVHATCEGEATWYDFTREIRQITKSKREIEPCTTKEFPRPAPRPANSRLENRARNTVGLQDLAHWQVALESFLTEHPRG